jgi:hypothetical protein
MPRNTFLNAIILSAICLVIGFGSGALLTMPNRAKIKSALAAKGEIERRSNELEIATVKLKETKTIAQQEIEVTKKEADKMVNHAKREAEKIVNDANKEAEGYVLLQREEMYKLYPNLKKYQQGINVVNERYIKSFFVTGPRDNKGYYNIKIKMQNDTPSDIKPRASIIFLNKQGFITDAEGATWLFSSIKPEETRIDEGACKFSYGEPVYYSIEFGD